MHFVIKKLPVVVNKNSGFELFVSYTHFIPSLFNFSIVVQEYVNYGLT